MARVKRGRNYSPMSQKQSKLALALRDRVLVRFTRPFEPGDVKGYLIDIGPSFFLLALIDGRIRFDGFQCFRKRDVRKLQVPAKYAAFAESVLKKRGERIPMKPPLDLTSLPELLSTANRAFPLVTIHRERLDPDICHIGRVVSLAKDNVSLLEIGPDARWDKKPETYRLREITRVDFGGDYEDALHLIGSAPTSHKHRQQ